MSLKHETLHGDITESLKRSQEFHMGLETIVARVSEGGYSAEAKKAMQVREETIARTEAMLSLRLKGRHGGESLDAGREQRLVGPTEASPTAIRARKGRFRSQLQEFNHRLALIKTGKVHPDFSENSFMSRMLETNLSPTSGTAASTFSHTEESEPRPLPHVSCLNGKTESPLHLPSFDEYCRTHYFKGTSLKPYLRKVEERISGLEKMKRRLQGLDILLAAKEQWDGDFELLEKLERHPAQKGAILSAKHANEVPSKFQRRRSVFPHRTHRKSIKMTTPKEAEKAIATCARDFQASKQLQEQHLDDIVQRLIIEKPFQLRHKAELFRTDRLADAHSIEIFNDCRRSLESARGQRVRRARAQAQIYEEMLRFLQGQKPPTDSQLQCLNAVRRLLEEGWVLTPAHCSSLQQAFSPADVAVHALLAVVKQSLI